MAALELEVVAFECGTRDVAYDCSEHDGDDVLGIALTESPGKIQFIVEYRDDAGVAESLRKFFLNAEEHGRDQVLGKDDLMQVWLNLNIRAVIGPRGHVGGCAEEIAFAEGQVTDGDEKVAGHSLGATYAGGRGDGFAEVF